MNINEYKNDIDTIEVKRPSMKDLENCMQKKKRQSNYAKGAILSIALVITLVISAVISPQSRLMTITVHAADGEKVSLSRKETTYKLEALASLVASDEQGLGTCNMELFFTVEGEDIDEVTISSSDDKIDREDIGKVDAYFVKIEKVTTKIYATLRKEDETKGLLLWSIQEGESDEVMYATLVGNSYSVKYDEQDKEQYALAIKVSENNDGTFSNEEILLNAKIEYLDGTIENKKIKIFASDDVFSGIQIALQ